MNHIPTYEKLGRDEITLDGVPLGHRDEFDRNPYLGAFKILAHASDVETALSLYGAFHKVLNRLPEGVKFTEDEIQEWVQWQTVGIEFKEKNPQTDRPLSICDIADLAFRLPSLSGSPSF